MQPNTVSNPVLSLARSIGKHLNGGILLMLMAALALVVANSSWSDEYFAFWLQPVHLQIGSFNVFNHGGHPLTLLEFINDALMVVFFFSTGMEIKREMLVGELSTVRQALLPVIAACGGMIMPVLIFAYIAYGTPGEAGMAIPMATDIAFSLGVLALFSKRVPLNLKIFLTTFAVADDIGGILVIALFYSSQRRRIGVQAVENLVKKYARQITTTKKITPHKLRSTYGTALYQETGDIYLVADVLGHRDVNTTKKHYAALDDARRRQAASAVRLREEE